jgi:hypothetical protein
MQYIVYFLFVEPRTAMTYARALWHGVNKVMSFPKELLIDQYQSVLMPS